MINLNFLNKIIKQGKIELVDPSEEISKAYLLKSLNNLKSAKILEDASLYEDSVGKSYYAMYNSLLALLFYCGVKSENHTGSIILLDLLFSEEELSNNLEESKKERVDKEYYVSTDITPEIIKPVSKQMIIDAEIFTLKIQSIITNLNLTKINEIREKFREMNYPIAPRCGVQ